MNVVIFDTETFIADRYDLRHMGCVPYLLDPRFELLSVQAIVDGVEYFWKGDEDWLSNFRAWDAEGRLFVAHYASFDLRLLKFRFGFEPRRRCCTVALCRYFGHKRAALEEIGPKLVGLEKLGGLPYGRRKSDLTTSEWGALKRYGLRDVQITKRIFDLLRPALPQQEMALIDHTLRQCLDIRPIDTDTLKEEIAQHTQNVATLTAKDAESAELVHRHQKLKELIKRRYGCDVTSTSLKALGDISRYPSIVRPFMEHIRDLRRAMTALKRFESFKTRMMWPGRNQAVLDYKYAYAVTHRWSSGSDEEGGVSFNTQNIERSSRLNEVWLAKSGRVCIIGDLAQVECRIIAFLAGEEKLLQLFRDPKIDVYCNFGQSVFGRLITKHDKMERLVAKEAVLGLGFLMGAARFAERLAARAPEAVEFLKKHRQTSDAEEAVRPIVEKYRQSFPLIRKFGLSVRDAYLRVTADDWPTDMPYCVEQRPGAGISVTKCSDRKTLAVKLPTWGTVYYREVARSARESKFRPGELEPVLHYVGGEISFSMPVENIVQATARDVMAHMLLRMESEGIRVVMHTHDELVAEVDMNKAKESLVRVRTIMSEPPPALIGLPLRTEPRLCDRYTKDEERSKAFETKLLGVSSPNRSSFVPVAGTADTTGLSRIVPMETPPKVVFL